MSKGLDKAKLLLVFLLIILMSFSGCVSQWAGDDFNGVGYVKKDCSPCICECMCEYADTNLGFSLSKEAKSMEEMGWYRAGDGCNWEKCDEWGCRITLMHCGRGDFNVKE